MARLETTTQIIANVWGFKCSKSPPSFEKTLPLGHANIGCRLLAKSGKETGFEFLTAYRQFKISGPPPWSCTFEPILAACSQKGVGCDRTVPDLYSVECKTMRRKK